MHTPESQSRNGQQSFPEAVFLIFSQKVLDMGKQAEYISAAR
jgi:hypothetical protein